MMKEAFTNFCVAAVSDLNASNKFVLMRSALSSAAAPVAHSASRGACELMGLVKDGARGANVLTLARIAGLAATLANKASLAVSIGAGRAKNCG